jgi:type IV pilus biogenesis protein CpaD/CtpE
MACIGQQVLAIQLLQEMVACPRCLTTQACSIFDYYDVQQQFVLASQDVGMSVLMLAGSTRHHHLRTHA